MADWIVCGLLAILVVGEMMDWSERKALKKILELLREIRDILRPEPQSFDIVQIGEKGMPTNNSIQAGQSGVFAIENLQPAGSAFASGVLPVWAASDTALTLTPSADGMKVDVAVPASDPNTSFSLGASYTRKTDGVVITKQITVTITPATTPEPTAFDIVQLS